MDFTTKYMGLELQTSYRRIGITLIGHVGRDQTAGRRRSGGGRDVFAVRRTD